MRFVCISFFEEGPRVSLILIPAPVDDLDEGELVDHFSQYVVDAETGDIVGELCGAMDLGDNDSRARVNEVEIEHIEVEGDSITISYRVGFEVFSGCRDLDSTWYRYRSIHGSKEGAGWAFDEYVAPDRLAPNEEL